VEVDTDFGTLADGVAVVTITVTVRDGLGTPLKGHEVQVAATGQNNTLTQPLGPTDSLGVATATLSTLFPEVKTVSAVVDPVGKALLLDDQPTTEFVRVPADSRYVRKSGDDSNDGRSPATAWATLGRAATGVIPGITVYVGAGTYTESVALSISGTVLDPIQFHADQAGAFAGDPGEVVVDAAGGLTAFHLDGVSNVELRGFSLTGAVPGAADGGAVLLGPGRCANVTLYENRIYGNGRGVHMLDASNVLLESNRISNNLGPQADAVYVEDGDTVNVLHNLIYNNAGSGVRVTGEVSDFAVDLCTLYRNGGDQVAEEITGSEGAVKNCIIAEGGADGVHFAAGTSLIEHNNLYWANAGLEFNDEAGGSIAPSSVVNNPLLADPFGFDLVLGGPNGDDDSFLVELGSPAFDIGDVTALAKVLPGGGALTGWTSRRDGTLDGSDTDGPQLNVGFHYPAPVDPFASLESGDARVYYARNPEVQVVSRAWDQDQDVWSPAGRTEPTSSRITWTASAVSQGPIPEELLAVLTDDGLSTRLFIRYWNGSFWSEDDVYDPFASAIRSERSGQRGFDVIFEDQSGDGMVVISDDTDNPRYRTLVNGEWSDELPVFADPPGTGPVLWVDLTAREGTDELAMVCLDEHQKLSAAIWNGSAWDPAAEVLLGDEVAEVFQSKCFDAAYESLSGDLLVSWGFNLFIEETRYAVKPADTTNWTILQDPSTDAVGTVVRLAAEPGTDRILAGVGEVFFDDDVIGMIWDGDAFVERLEIDQVASPAGADIGVGWVGELGMAVFVYQDVDGGGTLDWSAWTVGGWQVKPDALLPSLGDFVSAELRPIPGQDKLMMLHADDNGALFALEFDGFNWSISNGGKALDTDLDLASFPNDPFTLDFRR
jgi:parallel beta-helix repeat protein